MQLQADYVEVLVETPKGMNGYDHRTEVIAYIAELYKSTGPYDVRSCWTSRVKRIGVGASQMRFDSIFEFRHLDRIATLVKLRFG